MRILILRLEAPMMSFGSTASTEDGTTARFPGVSMIAGMLGNALGYDHAEPERLQRLQDRIRIASAVAEPGLVLEDFQTAAVGWNDKPWSTRGAPIARKSNQNTLNDGPILRRRQYWEDSSIIVALTLVDENETPTVDDLAAALDKPSRTLFIGRRTCLPAMPINDGVIDAGSLIEGLSAACPRPAEAQWPAESAGVDQIDLAIVSMVCDIKDVEAQLHMGARYVIEGKPERNAA